MDIDDALRDELVLRVEALFTIIKVLLRHFHVFCEAIRRNVQILGEFQGDL